MRRLWYILPLIAIAAGFFYLREEKPAVRVEPTPVRARRDIRVEVLNGCGVTGLAHKVGQRLRDLGFDVLTLDNADSYNYPESIVIDRVGNPEHVDRVAEALGIQNRIQQIIPDPFRIESVTLIIGKDYARLGLDRPVGQPLTQATPN